MRFLAVFLAAIVLAIPLSATAAGVSKFTFNDVTFEEGVTGELEASSMVKKPYTTCSYFSEDYRDYLGYFQSAEFASDDADEVLAFCLSHFADRDTH